MKMTCLFAGTLLAIVPLVTALAAQASVRSGALIQTTMQGASATAA